MNKKNTPMKLFQVTLKGFDGGTDATDHLIKWIVASSEADVEIVLLKLGVEYTEIEEILHGNSQNWEYISGVDLVVNSTTESDILLTLKNDVGEKEEIITVTIEPADKTSRCLESDRVKRRVDSLQVGDEVLCIEPGKQFSVMFHIVSIKLVDRRDKEIVLRQCNNWENKVTVAERDITRRGSLRRDADDLIRYVHINPTCQ